MENGYPVPRKKFNLADEEITELKWQQEGLAVLKKSPLPRLPFAAAIPNEQEATIHNFFTQEEAAVSSSWLHRALPTDPSFVGCDLGADLLSPGLHLNPLPRAAANRWPWPSMPSERRAELDQHLMMKGRDESGRPSTDSNMWKRLLAASMVAVEDSSAANVPAASEQEPLVSTEEEVGGGPPSGGGFERSPTSSPGGGRDSSATVGEGGVDDRKRMPGAAAGDGDSRHGEEEAEISVPAMKQGCGSAPSKRSRTAEVHNLSERKRRDRINDKMKALKQLIPHCNKSDKASMLDGAIEYLKSLKCQVQMMSMGCGMVPMMIPNVQQYMAPMGMGMRMGMGMGMAMDMGVNRPLMSFPSVITGSSLLMPATAPHFGPRFPMQNFHRPPVPKPDPPRFPDLVHPYQHYLGLHHTHMQAQNQEMGNPTPPPS